MTRLRDDRGGIMLLGAVMIPVFLLLGALVVDAGNWYTHKRQLQNRADAAAFAAGVAYAQNWKACVQNDDATLKSNTAQEIADAARQYAADPEASDYAGGVVPAPVYNQNIANQSKLDVVVNSTTYDDDTAGTPNDYTDDYDGNVATRIGNPCYNHPKNGDSISPGGGQWTDVRVTENKVGAIWKTFLPDISARARIEIRPAASGHLFLPLAIPDNVITRVQVRYYNECTSPPTLLATKDLAPLPAADQAAFASSGGGTLWGLPKPGSNPPEGDPSLSFGLTIPGYDSTCGPYMPIGVEVRVASRDEIDLNKSCSDLADDRFADCFHRLSQIRVWPDGNPDTEPLVKNVRILGGCGAPGDAYFGQIPVGDTDDKCPFDVSVQVDWGNRDDDNKRVETNFTVKANGTTLNFDSRSGETVTYTSTGGAFLFPAGPTNVSVSVAWEDTNATHIYSGTPCGDPPGPAKNICVWNESTEVAHRTFVGTKANAGAVAYVHTSQNGFVSGAPGPSFENMTDGGATVDVYPTIGTTTVLKTDILTTLRLDDPQANQSIDCDPDYLQPFEEFEFGCRPWYDDNKWVAPWWVDNGSGEKTCPNGGDWFSSSDLGAGFGLNGATNPWRCVLTAPGIKTGQVGDYMAVATKNCGKIENNACQVNSYVCNNDGNYDGKPNPKVPGDPGWKAQGGDSSNPRVINLFIVPYQSTKGLTGNHDPIPVLGFASFYVMNWTGSNNKQNDPCPDPNFDQDNDPSTPPIAVPAPPPGAMTGVFVEGVDFEPGPVDENAVCVEGQLEKCRAVLVR